MPRTSPKLRTLPAAYDRTALFQTIFNAATTTGLSQDYLRKGYKSGTVPHVKAGTKYMINVPALLQQLGIDPAIMQK